MSNVDVRSTQCACKRFLLLDSPRLSIFTASRRWEVPLDDVILNGQTLPKPQLPNGVGYTAMIDSVSFISVVSTLIRL